MDLPKFTQDLLENGADANWLFNSEISTISIKFDGQWKNAV